METEKPIFAKVAGTVLVCLPTTKEYEWLRRTIMATAQYTSDGRYLVTGDKVDVDPINDEQLEGTQPMSGLQKAILSAADSILGSHHTVRTSNGVKDRQGLANLIIQHLWDGDVRVIE